MSIVKSPRTLSEEGITWHEYLNHYEGECSEMAPKINDACSTIASNNSIVLKAEVLTIKGLISGLTIASSWQDAIGESYQNVITSCTNSLGEVVNSISETFKPSEDVYRKLKAWLKALSANNENYSAYNARKPNPEKDCYKDIITTMDPTTNTSSIEKVFNETVYKSDLQKWASNMERYYDQVIRLEKDIEDFLSQLDSYNGSSVAIDTSGSFSVSLNKMQLDIENNITSKIGAATIEYEDLFRTDGSSYNNAAVIWNFLKYKGLNDAQAAGVLSNIKIESASTFSPGIEEFGNSIGYGIIQWSFGRRTDLENAAKKAGVKVNDMQFQLEFLWDEAFTSPSEQKFNHPNGTNYYKSLKNSGFFTTGDAYNASKLFENIVENSGDKNKAGHRYNPAVNWYERLKNKDVLTGEDIKSAKLF